MALKLWITTLAVCLLTASCTSGTEGIFASIAREQKVVSLNGIDAAATVTSLVAFGSSYYATGGAALFSKPTSTGVTTWTSSTIGGTQNVTSVAVAGTTAGSNQALFAAANGSLWESTDGSAWNNITSQLNLAASSSVNFLVPIRNIDGYSSDRFVVVSSVPVANSSSTLPNYNQITLITGFASGTLQQKGPIAVTVSEGTTPLTSFQAPILTAVKMTSGEYYVASESYLWNLDSTFATLTFVANSANYNGVRYNGFRGLLAFRVSGDGQDQLFLTTQSLNETGGGLYRAVAPTGTTVSFAPTKDANGNNVADQHDTNSNAMTFTTMMYCPANNSLWIGTGPVTSTEGDGYAEYSMTIAASQGIFYQTPTSINSDNYNSTVLPTSAVGCFYVDTSTTPNVYFMGMSAEGLWGWAPDTHNWVQQ